MLSILYYHPSMKILTIYAGGVLSLAVARALIYIGLWSNAINVFAAKTSCVQHPYVLGRHSFPGSWARASVLIDLGYATLNQSLSYLFQSPITVDRWQSSGHAFADQCDVRLRFLV